MAHLQCDAEAETNQPPLLVKLTGYRLLTILMTLAFGVPKAIQKVKGETLTDLDWVIGITLGIGLWWLGQYATVDSPHRLWFFHCDYSRGIAGVCVLPAMCLVMYLTFTVRADALRFIWAARPNVLSPVYFMWPAGPNLLSPVYLIWACFSFLGKAITAMTVYLILVCVPIFAPNLTVPAFVLVMYCEFEYVSLRLVFFFVYIPILLLSIYGHYLLGEEQVRQQNLEKIQSASRSSQHPITN